jgi:hypothetical protein
LDDVCISRASAAKTVAWMAGPDHPPVAGQAPNGPKSSAKVGFGFIMKSQAGMASPGGLRA